MPDSLVIQRITTDDLASSGKLNRLFDQGKVWHVDQGRKFLANPDNILLVAFVDGVPAGFATGYRLQRFDDRGAEILLYEIGVDQDFRRRGIGKAIIEKLKRWGKTVDADELWVLTEKSNQAGMALYQSSGGTEDSDQTTMFTYHL